MDTDRPSTADYQIDEEYYQQNLALYHPKFKELAANKFIDVEVKQAALRLSPSVVALVSYSGEEQLCHTCGTIIEADADNTITVLTSANLIRRPSTDYVVENNLADNLKVTVHTSVASFSESVICAYDFHFNLAVIKFVSPVSLPTARLRRIDDCLSFILEENRSFQLRPHSAKLVPGDVVTAVGRYFRKPFDLMAAPGKFSTDRVHHDCKELCLVTCRISRCGDGAPISNISGEVIGVGFHDSNTVFLPINIVIKWWDHYKIHGELRHPRLGFEATNLYLVRIDMVERLIRRFPSISGGIVVDKVIIGSSAHSAGLRQDDVIVRCNGRMVESYLELLEVMWDSIGENVEIVVARDDCHDLLTLKMMVVEATLYEINSWPHWEHS
ncbi:hypothetical protein RND81_14G078800 [Saponaria officinalis]|uniref:PDZ domain-containing protein n=1 Tax=Saponaria officinalis TaxID=3572 RepID=A0AAW1GKG9_SAPOF